MTKFAQIILPNALNDDFTYFALENQQIGDVVLVEFGRQKLWGIVISLHDEEPNNFDVKKIKKVLEIHQKIKLTLNQIKFIETISSYNLASRGLVLKSFIGILNSDKVQKEFTPLTHQINEKNFHLKTLLPDQQNIYNEICQDLNSSQTFLIDGVTGSGKTEIYFAIIAEILKKDASSQILILLPEIALTSQLLSRFEEQFGFRPALWHSKISKKHKREIYFGVANGTVKVLIGARSSLLLPFKNLRLIVIDEEHDSSFKQEDIFNFHARDMAIVKSKFENFPIILSTATPALETYNNAKSGKYKQFLLTQKFGTKNVINFIDLRQEKIENNHILSRKLREEIAKNLLQKKQSLLFLNRRGYSPITLCKSCGKKYDCPNCDFHLVLHKHKNLLICHHCGHQEKVLKNCKYCNEENSLISIGTGVEKLLEEVRLVFPDAKIASINSDEIKSFEDAEKIVKDISCGTIDIIIGTQMISKGYDFANLNLVGIVDADSMLYSSDLRALERAYQVFTQVMGRAGRRDESGKIIIQTFNPQNLLFEKIALDDKKDFYDFELNNRRQLNLPPFTQMARFEISAQNEQEAKNFAKNLLKYFPIDDKIEIFGPAPAPLQKLKNRHHFLIHLKVDKKVNLQKLINDITSKIEIPNKYRLRININPF